MKLLAFSDTHGDIYAIRDIAARADEADVLVCAGDISNFGEHLHELVAQLDVGKPLFMVPGNHELPHQIAALEHEFDFVKSLHLKMHTLDGNLFFGCGGGGLSRFHTPFELSESSFAATLKKFKLNHRGKVIFVAHAPPYGVLDEVRHRHIGVRNFRDFILRTKPDLVICGHVHEHGGERAKLGQTTVINGGRAGLLQKI